MLVWKRSKELAEDEDARCVMRATKMSWTRCEAALMGVFFRRRFSSSRMGADGAD